MIASIEQRLADELSVSVRQVTAAMALLDEGATVPFIARYRKEMTGGLDDSQLRLLQERLVYLRELEQRRQTVIDSIRAQDKMTPELLAAIQQAQDKQALEDIYLPFRPKRRTRAKLAVEAELDKLADSLMENPLLNPEEEAIRYIRQPFSTPDGDNPGVADVKAALDGARQVLMERFSEDAVLLATLREFFREHGVLVSRVTEGAEQEGVRRVCGCRCASGWSGAYFGHVGKICIRSASNRQNRADRQGQGTGGRCQTQKNRFVDDSQSGAGFAGRCAGKRNRPFQESGRENAQTGRFFGQCDGRGVCEAEKTALTVLPVSCTRSIERTRFQKMGCIWKIRNA